VRRFAVAVGVLLISLIAVARTAGALAPSAVGWWWVAETGAAAVPPPPTVPAGGFMVGGDPTGANSIAAFRFELPPGEGSPVLTLSVVDNGDVNSADGNVAACPATSAWAPTAAGAWASRPSFACAKSAKGVRAADGKQWTFNLAPLVVNGRVDVVLVPASGTNFNLTFNPPNSSTVKTSPAAVAPAIDTSPAVEAPVEAAPLIDTSSPPLEAPSFVAAPTDEAPLATGAQTGAARALGAPSGSAAPSRSVSGLAVLLLLGVGAAGYALHLAPSPAVRGLGPLPAPAARWSAAGADTVQMGGLGRFARPRRGPPPRL